MKDPNHLLMDPVVENTLRNLSVSPKKVPNMIMELSELCSSSNANEAMKHLVEQSALLSRLEHSTNLFVDGFNDADIKRINGHLNRNQQAPKHQTAFKVNQKIFQKMLLKVSQRELDLILLSVLQSNTLINDRTPKIKKSNSKNKISLEPLINYSAEISSIIVHCRTHTIDMKTTLILLKLFLQLLEDSDQDWNLNTLNNSNNFIWNSMSRSTILHKNELKIINEYELSREHLQAFQSIPRIILGGGQPTKLSINEVTGKAIGIIGSIMIKSSVEETAAINSQDRFSSDEHYYYEVNVKGTKSFAGVRIGWMLCGSELCPQLGSRLGLPGDSNDSWVFAPASMHFFHDAYRRSMERKALNQEDNKIISTDNKLIKSKSVDATASESANSASQVVEDIILKKYLFKLLRDYNLLPNLTAEALKQVGSSTDAESIITMRQNSTASQGSAEFDSSLFDDENDRNVKSFLRQIKHLTAEVTLDNLLQYLNHYSLSVQKVEDFLIETFGPRVESSEMIKDELLIENKDILLPNKDEKDSSSVFPLSMNFLRELVSRVGGRDSLKNTDSAKSTNPSSNSLEEENLATEGTSNSESYLHGGSDLITDGATKPSLTGLTNFIIGCSIHVPTGTMDFFLNGQKVGTAPDPIPIKNKAYLVRGICPVFSSNPTTTMEFNWGQHPFKHLPIPSAPSITPSQLDTKRPSTAPVGNDSHESESIFQLSHQRADSFNSYEISNSATTPVLKSSKPETSALLKAKCSPYLTLSKKSQPSVVDEELSGSNKSTKKSDLELNNNTSTDLDNEDITSIETGQNRKVLVDGKVIISPCSSDAFKSLTFEIGFRLHSPPPQLPSEIEDTLKSVENSASNSRPSTSKSQTDENSTALESQFILFSCGASSFPNLAAFDAVEGGLLIGVDEKGSIFLDLSGCERIKSPEKLVQPDQWYNFTLQYVYHRSTSKSNLTMFLNGMPVHQLEVVAGRKNKLCKILPKVVTVGNLNPGPKGKRITPMIAAKNGYNWKSCDYSSVMVWTMGKHPTLERHKLSGMESELLLHLTFEEVCGNYVYDLAISKSVLRNHNHLVLVGNYSWGILQSATLPTNTYDLENEFDDTTKSILSWLAENWMEKTRPQNDNLVRNSSALNRSNSELLETGIISTAPEFEKLPSAANESSLKSAILPDTSNLKSITLPPMTSWSQPINFSAGSKSIHDRRMKLRCVIAALVYKLIRSSAVFTLSNFKEQQPLPLNANLVAPSSVYKTNSNSTNNFKNTVRSIQYQNDETSSLIDPCESTFLLFNSLLRELFFKIRSYINGKESRKSTHTTSSIMQQNYVANESQVELDMTHKLNVALCIALLRALKAHLIAVLEIATFPSARISVLGLIPAENSQQIYLKLLITLLCVASISSESETTSGETIAFDTKTTIFQNIHQKILLESKDAKTEDLHSDEKDPNPVADPTKAATENMESNNSDVEKDHQQLFSLNLLISEVLAVILTGIDLFIPNPHNQLYMLECALVSIQKERVLPLGNVVYMEIYSKLSKLPSNVVEVSNTESSMSQAKSQKNTSMIKASQDPVTKHLTNDALIALLNLQSSPMKLFMTSLANVLSKPNSTVKLLPPRLWPMVVGDQIASHKFLPKSGQIAVSNSTLIPRPGDVVQRGPHWRYADQDGGLGSCGIVIEVRSWLNEQDKSLSIVWQNGHINSYRWGSEESTYECAIENASTSENASKVDASNGHFDVQIYCFPERIAASSTPAKNLALITAVSSTTDTSSSLNELVDKAGGNSNLKTDLIAFKSKTKPSSGELSKKILSYTPDEISKALVEQKTSGLTKRSVLQYILDNSTPEWQEKMKLGRSLNSLMMKFNTVDVTNLYSEFHQTFALNPSSSNISGSVDQTSDIMQSSNWKNLSPIPFEPRLKNGTVYSWTVDQHIERLGHLMVLLLREVQNESSSENSSSTSNAKPSSEDSSVIGNYDHKSPKAFSGLLRLLVSFQSALTGAYGWSPDEVTSLSITSPIELKIAANPMHLITFGGKNGVQFKWDLLRGIWIEAEDGELNRTQLHRNRLSEDENSTQLPPSKTSNSRWTTPPELKSVKMLFDLSIDENVLGGNVLMKIKSGSTELTQKSDRGWNTFICTTAILPNTGVYRWYVKIKNFSERRGHCMIGVATSEVSCDEFLGQGLESWGLSPNLDLFHAGRKKKSENGKKLSCGSVVEVTLDTDKSTLYFTDITTGYSLGSKLKASDSSIYFSSMRKERVFPAFSLYSPGDCISILSSMDEVFASRNKATFGSDSSGPDAYNPQIKKSIGQAIPSSNSFFSPFNSYLQINTPKSLSVSNQSNEKALMKAKSEILGSPQHIIIDLLLHLVSSAKNILEVEEDMEYLQHPIVSFCLTQLFARLYLYQFVSNYKIKQVQQSTNALLGYLKSAIYSVRQKRNSPVNSTEKVIQPHPAVSAALEVDQVEIGIVQDEVINSVISPRRTEDIPFVKITTYSKDSLIRVERRLMQLHVVASLYLGKIFSTWISTTKMFSNNLNQKSNTFGSVYIDNQVLVEQISRFGSEKSLIDIFKFNVVTGEGLTATHPSIKNLTMNDWLQSELFSKGLHSTPNNSLPHVHLPAEIQDLLRSESKISVLFFKWISLHDSTHKNFKRFGGPDLNTGVKINFLVNIYHTGYNAALTRSYHLFHNTIEPNILSGFYGPEYIEKFNTMAIDELRDFDYSPIDQHLLSLIPPAFVMVAWENAMKLRLWAKDVAVYGVSYDFISQRLCSRGLFLLELESCSTVKNFDRHESTLAKWLSTFPQDAKYKDHVVTTTSETFSSIKNFVAGSCSILHLRALLSNLSLHAERRKEGFLGLRSSLENIAPYLGCGSKIALLMKFSQSLKGSLITIDSTKVTTPSSTLTPSTSSYLSAVIGAQTLRSGQASFQSNQQSGHYLQGVECIPRSQSLELQGSFEVLYTSLTEELSLCNSPDEAPYQLTLIECLGVRIVEHDHTLLSRVHFFYAIQEMLDSCLALISNDSKVSLKQVEEEDKNHNTMTLIPPPLVSRGNTAVITPTFERDMDVRLEMSYSPKKAVDEKEDSNPDGIETNLGTLSWATESQVSLMSIELQKLVVKAGMKLFILMSLQVATSPDQEYEESLGNNITNAPILRKVKSGPATLGRAVFDILYSQLSDISELFYGIAASQKMDKRDEIPNHVNFVPTITVSASAFLIMSEATMLLLCVSRDSTCQQILTKPKWIMLLLKMAILNQPLCQYRALLLLSDLLPKLELNTWQIGTEDYTRFYDWLILDRSSFMQPIAFENELKLFSADQDGFSMMDTLRSLIVRKLFQSIGKLLISNGLSPVICCSNEEFLKSLTDQHEPVISETISLVRQLYISPLWNKVVESFMMKILKSVTENEFHIITTHLLSRFPLLFSLTWAVHSVLGGHIDVYYPNSPVIFQSPNKNTIQIGLFESRNQSSIEKLNIVHFENSSVDATNNASNSFSSIASGLKHVTTEIHMDKANPVSRCPALRMYPLLSEELMEVIIQFDLHSLVESEKILSTVNESLTTLNVPSTPSMHSEDKSERILLEVKTEKTSSVTLENVKSSQSQPKDSVTVLADKGIKMLDDPILIGLFNKSVFRAFASICSETACARRMASTLDKCIPRDVEKSLNTHLETSKQSSPILSGVLRLLNESQRTNKSCGIADIPFYEEYLMITLRLRMKSWATNCQAAHNAEQVKHQQELSKQNKPDNDSTLTNDEKKLESVKTEVEGNANSEDTTKPSTDEVPNMPIIESTEENKASDNQPVGRGQWEIVREQREPGNSISDFINSKLEDMSIKFEIEHYVHDLVQSNSNESGTGGTHEMAIDSLMNLSLVNEGVSSSSSFPELVQSLMQMGFPKRLCEMALSMCGDDPEEALQYLLTKGNRLEMLAVGLEVEELMNPNHSSQHMFDHYNDGPGSLPSIQIANNEQDFIEQLGDGELIDKSNMWDSNEIKKEESVEGGVFTYSDNSAPDHRQVLKKIGMESTSNDFASIFHYDGSCDKLLPIYSAPSYNSERVGCIYPGDDITVVKQMCDESDPTILWYKVPFSEFYDGSYQPPDGENIMEVFVWIPKVYNGEEVIKAGQFPGDTETVLTSPPGETFLVDKYYQIVGLGGALVRDGIEIDSREITTLQPGVKVHVLEETFNSEGTIRLRIEAPVGWISKLFGLVKLVSDANKSDPLKDKNITKTPEKLKPETGKNSKVDELGLLISSVDDNMEISSGGDAYNKEDRHFNSMQSYQFLRYRDREKTASSRMFNKRMRISSCNSHSNYFNGAGQSVEAIDKFISETTSILRILYCRKIFLSLLIINMQIIFDSYAYIAAHERSIAERKSKYSLISKSNYPTFFEKIFETSSKATVEDVAESKTVHDVSTKKSEDVQTSAYSLANQFYIFLRFVVFRGEPFSYTGLELLPFDEVTSLALSTRPVSVEQILDEVVWCILNHNNEASENEGISDETSQLFSKSLMENSVRSNLIHIFMESIAKTIRLATAPKYADHFWADSSYEEDHDSDLVEQPNLHYAVWISRILIQLDDPEITRNIFNTWCVGLRGSSLSLKHIAFTTLSEIIHYLHQKITSNVAGNSAISSTGEIEELKSEVIHSHDVERTENSILESVLKKCLDLIPIDRLKMLCLKRLWYEMEDHPLYSRFIQALLNLLSDFMIYSRLKDNSQSGITFDLNKTAQSKLVEDHPIESEKDISDSISEAFVITEPPTTTKESPRSVIRFSNPNSHMMLSPQKDLSGNWTVEFWLFRRESNEVIVAKKASDGEKENKMESTLEPTPDIVIANLKQSSHNEDVSTSQQNAISAATSPSDDSDRSLTGLLNLILGSGKSKSISGQTVTPVIGSSSASLENSIAATMEGDNLSSDLVFPTTTPKSNASSKEEIKSGPPVEVKQIVLLSSSKCHLKLRSGGRQFNKETQFHDPCQLSDPIADEADCMSVGQTGSSEKSLDCVVPMNKWVHLAIVCQCLPSSLSVYLDGELQDTITYHMNLPVASIGSPQSGISFNGDIAEFRMWAIARSEEEIKRDMFTDVLGMRKLIAYLGCSEGSGTLTQDRTGVFNSCKLHNCEWAVSNSAPLIAQPPKLPLFMIHDTEASEGFFGEEVGCSAQVVEMTGIIKIAAQSGVQGELAQGINEVVTLNYRTVPDNSGLNAFGSRNDIEGFISFPERNVRSRCRGLRRNDGSIKIWTSLGNAHTSWLDGEQDGCTAVLGPPEQVDLLKHLILEGTIADNSLTGNLFIRCSVIGVGVHAYPPSKPQIDTFLLPNEINYTSVIVSSNPRMSTITVKDTVKEGQYVVSIEVPQNLSLRKEMLTATSYTKGNFKESSNNIELLKFPRIEDIIERPAIEISSNDQNVELEIPSEVPLNNDQSFYSAFGICQSEGCLWIRWKIIHSGNIGFGACTDDSIIHPDASVDANDGTWMYSTFGQASHGSNLFLCDTAEEKDYIDMQINMNVGTIEFYKNDRFLIEFRGINDHKNVSHDSGSLSSVVNANQPTVPLFRRGIRPIVSLSSPNESVGFYGSREGLVVLNYEVDDPWGRKLVISYLINGCYSGFSGIYLANKTLVAKNPILGVFFDEDNVDESNEETWFGFWNLGQPDGFHFCVDTKQLSDGKWWEKSSLPVKKIKEIVCGKVLQTIQFGSNSKDYPMEDLEAGIKNVKTQLSLLSVNLAKIGRDLNGTVLDSTSTETNVALSTKDPANLSLIGSPLLQLNVPLLSAGNEDLKIIVRVRDSSGDEIFYKVSRSMLLKKLMISYAAKKGIPSCRSFEFKCGSNIFQEDQTFESYHIQHNNVIDVNVKSIINGKEKDIEQFIEESEAPYVLKVIFEQGATVRSGVEIEESPSIRALTCGEIIEAFKKSHTIEGIGRFQIADGWISEKLRGGTESRVVQVLKERLPRSITYQVVREEGANIRAGCSLYSDAMGCCPNKTILKVSEKRFLKVETEKDPTLRVKIEHPIEWRGWASAKPHIMVSLDEGDAVTTDGSSNVLSGDLTSIGGGGVAIDPVYKQELVRRTAFRQDKKRIKKVQALKINMKFQSRLIAVRGSLTVSEETFFLMKKGVTSNSTGTGRKSSSSTGGILVSNDFTTVSCVDPNGGRTMAFGSRGFTKGIHYWEVLVNQANWGSVFIGVAPEDSSGWGGYGLLNYRATQAYGSETLYGSYYSVGDIVGVLLDMDHGTISFFKDGEDFNVGKVRVINMGVAYHNLRRSNSRSSNTTLFPCFGVKSNGDQLTLRQSHWVSYSGLGSRAVLNRALEAKKLVYLWSNGYSNSLSSLSLGLVEQMYEGYKKWRNKDRVIIRTRPGIEATIDTSIDAIEKVAGEFGASYALRAGKPVMTQYGKGKILGARHCQLWYSYDHGDDCNWYWNKDEIPDLVRLGKIRFDLDEDENANTTSSVKVEKENSDSTGIVMLKRTPSLLVDVLSLEEFQSGLLDTQWSLDEDEKICQVVNNLTHKFDVDPLRITASDLEKYIVSTGLLPGKSPYSIQARYAALCVLNKAASVVVPLVDLNTEDNRSPLICTDLCRFNLSTYSSREPLSSISGSSLHNIKRALFIRTKLGVWDLALKETTTPTSAPPDEYERPEDLREITINRVEIRNMEKIKDSIQLADRFKASVFGQLMTIMSWDDRSLRRSYVHLQDAGQARAFFVKFVGEGVDDQGGPYRAVFQSSIGEEAMGLLELLQPCPNAKAQIGENRDKYVFNPAMTSQIGSSAFYVHLGKLIAMAIRHKILVPLSFPSLCWKPLTGETVSIGDLFAIDSAQTSTFSTIASTEFNPSPSTDDGNDFDYHTSDDIRDLLVQALQYCSNFVLPSTHLSNYSINKVIDFSLQKSEVVPKQSLSHQKDNPVNEAVELLQYLNLISQAEGLKSLYRGMSSILPCELFALFTPDELEQVFCGEAEVDIEVLKKATVYDGVSPNDPHIRYFWEALEDMSSEERSQFINFCSGRSRLPASASDYPMSFILNGPPPHSESTPNNYLPIARTCFFTLSLPKYSSKEICLQKLKYAIRNTELMDADFIDRRATSGWENIR